jgi:hypothetical protein
VDVADAADDDAVRRPFHGFRDDAFEAHAAPAEQRHVPVAPEPRPVGEAPDAAHRALSAEGLRDIHLVVREHVGAEMDAGPATPRRWRRSG